MIINIEKLIKETPDNIIIIGHKNSDLDATVSALLLKYFFKNILGKKKISLLFPDGVSRRTKNILDNMGIKLRYRVNINNISRYNVAYFLDTGGFDILGKVGIKILDSRIRKILIDHHKIEKGFSKKFNIVISIPTASSTLEIILNIISKYMNILSLNSRYYDAILTTLYVETRFLTLASSDALYWFSKFRKHSSLSTDELRRLITYTPDISEKIAVLKALKRMSIYRYNTHLLVISELSAYMNQASSHLLRLGVDLVIMYTTKKKCKIHMRIGDTFITEFKIDVYSEFLEKYYSGNNITYGGHLGIINIDYGGRECNIFIEKFITNFLRYLKDRYGLDFKLII